MLPLFVHDDPVAIAIALTLLLFVFLLYLFIRRTTTAFREGMQDEKR
jgi:hypothetical protein